MEFSQKTAGDRQDPRTDNQAIKEAAYASIPVSRRQNRFRRFLGVSKNRGFFPQNGWWKWWENPDFLMDDLGGKPTIFGNTQVVAVSKTFAKIFESYCWWLKSQTTTWDGAKIFVNNGIIIILILVQDFWNINSIWERFSPILTVAYFSDGLKRNHQLEILLVNNFSDRLGPESVRAGCLTGPLRTISDMSWVWFTRFTLSTCGSLSFVQKFRQTKVLGIQRPTLFLWKFSHGYTPVI